MELKYKKGPKGYLLREYSAAVSKVHTSELGSLYMMSDHNNNLICKKLLDCY